MKGGKASFHAFPKNNDMARKWINLCKRDNVNLTHARVCNLHFAPDAYRRHLKYELLQLPVPRTLVRLKEDAIPTLHLPVSEGKFQCVVLVAHYL